MACFTTNLRKRDTKVYGGLANHVGSGIGNLLSLRFYRVPLFRQSPPNNRTKVTFSLPHRRATNLLFPKTNSRGLRVVAIYGNKITTMATLCSSRQLKHGTLFQRMNAHPTKMNAMKSNLPNPNKNRRLNARTLRIRINTESLLPIYRATN